ncbi:MAG: hypothetical protein GY702_03625, partial [Desulfobulbaceae bacterium]|nr:hypothetical protein [Desulfobulbaceae bacterium]
MRTLSDEENELIETWDSNQTESINVKYIESGLKEDKNVENFLSVLTKSASHINIKKELKGENSLPEIVIIDNIRYSAVPLSNELKPFLKALSPNYNDRKSGFSQKVKTNLEKINIPIALKLFAAEG